MVTTVKERPIIFSTDMVKAILDGRKTQTRRVIKPAKTSATAKYFDPEENNWPIDQGTGKKLLCPYGQIGDRLWVREAHKLEMVLGEQGEKWVKCSYRFDMENDGGVRWFRWADLPLATQRKLVKIKTWNKWRPARFMYKFLACIWLEITAVRVERLQEIDYFGARAEGILSFNADHPDPTNDGMGYNRGASGLPMRYDSTVAFMDLWNSLNAKRGYGWEVNPWVWVIEFNLASKGAL